MVEWLIYVFSRKEKPEDERKFKFALKCHSVNGKKGKAKINSQTKKNTKRTRLIIFNTHKQTANKTNKKRESAYTKCMCPRK